MPGGHNPNQTHTKLHETKQNVIMIITGYIFPIMHTFYS